MAHILIVEDDEQLAASMRDWLLIEGHNTTVLYNGRHAFEWLSLHDCDLIILDVVLPGLTGIELCKSYRSKQGQARVLMVTAKGSVTEKESGFEVGADDYLCKPFDPRELSARVKALMRRSLELTDKTIEIGDLCLNIERHTAMRASVEIKLLPQEFVLLEFLMRNPNRIFDADTLVRRLWRDQSSVDTVRTHIKTLRKKVDFAGMVPMIKTVHGVGYSLVCP